MSSPRTAIERADGLLRRSGLPPRQIQDAGHGSHNHLLVVELNDGPLLLLRLPMNTELYNAPKVLRAEAEAILLTQNLLPVPHPVALIPSRDEPEGSLMPILNGTRVTDLRQRGLPNVDLARICEQLGDVLARLHRIRLPEGQETAIRRLFDDIDDSDVLLHGDAHLGNLLAEHDPKKGWNVTGIIDWSFVRWGPPEADLVEMAICEAEPRPRLGRVFYEAYVNAGGLPPREPVLRRALIRELERRLRQHAQAQEMPARDTWTRWLEMLHRPGASALRVFDSSRAPGRGMA